MEFLWAPVIWIALIIAFYIPGKVILGSFKTDSYFTLTALSFILGLVLWGWQAYIFGFLHQRNFSYFYLFIFIFLFIKRGLYRINWKYSSFKNLNILGLIIIVIGVFGQIVQYLRNGQVTSLGLYFSDKNILDHSFHASLVNELIFRFPPFVPGMYGVDFTNYHFWYHLVTAELIRVFHIPLMQTQFLGMFILGPILLGLIGYSFASSVFKSIMFRNLFLFLLYFAGDICTLFNLFIRHQLNFSLTLGWLFENGTYFMDSPGAGFAVIIFLAGIYLIYLFLKKYSLKILFLSGLMVGSVIGFKIYFGIPILFGLFCLTIFHLFQKKFATLFILIIAVLLSAIQFLPFNASSGGLLFLPFEIPRQFFAQKQMNMSYIDQRWRIYLEHNNIPRLFEYGLFMSIIYFLMQFSIKLIGVIPVRKIAKIIGTDYYIFLYSIFFVSIILGLFFYQKVGGANIWEFFLPVSLILSIFTALIIGVFLQNKPKIIQIIILFLIVLILIPRWLESTVGNISDVFSPEFHGIINNEYQAFLYLENNTPPNSLILIMNPAVNFIKANETIIFTQRPLYYSGIGVTQNETPEIRRRKKVLENILVETRPEEITKLLKNNKIKYLLFYNPPKTKINITKLPVKKVFSNNLTSIYKVNN